MSEPPSDPWLGQVERGYVPESLVHVGSLACVYRGRGSDGEAVAIKIYGGAFAQGSPADAILRFEREAELGCRVVHENVVRHLDAFVTQGGDALVISEWVDGVTLDVWQRSPQSFDRVLSVMAQSARGLAAIHAKGIVHRDIKPSNILIRQHGESSGVQVRVADFNHAIASDAARVTREGKIAGTSRYLAPEVLEGERATPRSDLYALGVTFDDLVLATAVETDRNSALRDVITWLREPDSARRMPSAEVLGATLHALSGVARARRQ